MTSTDNMTYATLPPSPEWTLSVKFRFLLGFWAAVFMCAGAGCGRTHSSPAGTYEFKDGRYECLLDIKVGNIFTQVVVDREKLSTNIVNGEVSVKGGWIRLSPFMVTRQPNRRGAGMLLETNSYIDLEIKGAGLFYENWIKIAYLRK